MSRGGTRKARAAQEQRRRTRRRKTRAAVSRRERRAEEKRLRPKGRGRAAVLHLSGFPGPLVLALGLALSGQPDSRLDAAGYWMAGLVESPNASYLSEPGGLILAAAVFALAALLFTLVPLGLWRYLYRSHDVLVRDWTSIDGPFTVMTVTGLVWVYRIFAGFSDPVSTFALLMVAVSAYVAVFSAILTVAMPVIPGSGRIGGILPGWLRMKYAERYVLDEEQRETLRAFAAEKERAAAEEDA